MSDHRRVRVIVTGRVQGVFFRDATQQTAERLSLTGYVRNLHDGRVEAVFQGPSDAVGQAIDFCRQGPGHAAVNDVSAEDQDPRDDESGFRVL